MKKLLVGALIALGLTGAIAACPVNFINDTNSSVIVAAKALTQDDQKSYFFSPGSLFGTGTEIKPGDAKVVKPNKDRAFFVYEKIHRDIPVQKLTHTAKEEMSTTQYQFITQVGFINKLEGEKVECDKLGNMPRKLKITEIKDPSVTFGLIKTEGLTAGTTLKDFMEKGQL